MSDSNDCYKFSDSYFGLGFDEPKQDNSKEIEELTERIDELEKDLKIHVQGRYGILHIPTKVNHLIGS